MFHFLKAFARDQSGASAIEYALVVALISLGMLGGSVTLASAMGFKFMEFARELYSAF
jgi:Flp pilus assembly pilin Flp